MLLCLLFEIYVCGLVVLRIHMPPVKLTSHSRMRLGGWDAPLPIQPHAEVPEKGAEAGPSASALQLPHVGDQDGVPGYGR